ncbi:hypothetical protein D8Y22_06410 [Salinadaptatus halalkaliphilus]|uniref:Uncharacterized protein n=1 Tax=Salinadaptatus halalkaliphilus TaxID=2419781 RepID=A0A4S3TR37_9EURY|nr:hypothetical protein [Salinadaptatus halalkaliphilus]THE65793.1 hypothetical protein D8Y22_06410 [Salinadaptatus halalkaliphilus]
MSTGPPVTEVFPHVEPDPDAVLERYGVDSPAALVATAERDDPAPPRGTGACDAAVAESVADWTFVGEPTSVTIGDDALEAAVAAISRTNRSQSVRTGAAGSGGGPCRSISAGRSRRPTSAVDDSRRSPPLEVRSADDLELVGPEPTTRRVPDETFGRDGFVFGRACEDA